MMGLYEPLPDHSSLTRIMERFSLRVFRGFFERIVQECFDAGLVRGEELFIDATIVTHVRSMVIDEFASGGSGCPRTATTCPKEEGDRRSSNLQPSEP
jgi:hypothetical protein